VAIARGNRPRTSPARGAAGHPVLVGVLIGLLLGLCLALGVALYLNKMSPFTAKEPKQKDTPAAKEQPPTGAARSGLPAGLPQAAAKPAEPKEPKEEGKPRFDFYEILPGKQEPAARRDTKEQEREVTYLQAGAFQKSADADNLKARLALAGLEAQIQTATLSDNSVWHRVRLGPYATSAELDRARAVLRENKIEASVIKVTVREPKS
jgi:cell division protein FtsN